MRDIKIWHLLNVCFVSYLMSYYIGPRGTKIQLDNFFISSYQFTHGKWGWIILPYGGKCRWPLKWYEIYIMSTKCDRTSLLHGLSSHDITYTIPPTGAKYKSDCETYWVRPQFLFCDFGGNDNVMNDYIKRNMFSFRRQYMHSLQYHNMLVSLMKIL